MHERGDNGRPEGVGMYHQGTKYGPADSNDFGPDGRPCWACDHGVRADEFCATCAQCRRAGCSNAAISDGICGGPHPYERSEEFRFGFARGVNGVLACVACDHVLSRVEGGMTLAALCRSLDHDCDPRSVHANDLLRHLVVPLKHRHPDHCACMGRGYYVEHLHWSDCDDVECCGCFVTSVPCGLQ